MDNHKHKEKGEGGNRMYVDKADAQQKAGPDKKSLEQTSNG